MGYKTTAFGQAQSAYDHMEEPEDHRARRIQWAHDTITDALCGSDSERSDILKMLGMDEDEYRDTWSSDPDAVADEYCECYLSIRDRLESEY